MALSRLGHNIPNRDGNQRRHRDAACTGKIRHESAEAAHEFLRRGAEKGYIIQCSTAVYPCEYCGGWHVGHSRGESKANTERRQTWNYPQT